MNTQIKELVKKSGTDSSGKWMSIDNAEKFAELIVRECGKVIVNGGYRNPAFGEKHPLTPPEIATMIKEHFGVEE